MEDARFDMREFFAENLDGALEKASQALRIPQEELEYKVVEGEFRKPMSPLQVAILVKVEEGKALAVKHEIPPEETQAREAGEVEWANFLLKGILERMNIECRTSVSEKGEHMVITVELLNENFDFRRGESRELRGAIQHIVNRAVSRGGDVDRRFILDIGGKLEERSEQMARMAEEMTGTVQRIEKPIHIHLMDSQDRRLLHLNLVERPDLQTQGQGEKQFRVLRIEARKARDVKGKEQD